MLALPRNKAEGEEKVTWRKHFTYTFGDGGKSVMHRAQVDGWLCIRETLQKNVRNNRDKITTEYFVDPLAIVWFLDKNIGHHQNRNTAGLYRTYTSMEELRKVLASKLKKYPCKEAADLDRWLKRKASRRTLQAARTVSKA